MILDRSEAESLYNEYKNHPDVIGYGHGWKHTDGKITDTEALILRVMKKEDDPSNPLPSEVSINGKTIAVDIKEGVKYLVNNANFPAGSRNSAGTVGEDSTHGSAPGVPYWQTGRNEGAIGYSAADEIFVTGSSLAAQAQFPFPKLTLNQLTQLTLTSANPTPYSGASSSDLKSTVMCGLSLGNQDQSGSSTGTLGFLAVDNDTGHLVGVSNAHVLSFNITNDSEGVGIGSDSSYPAETFSFGLPATCRIGKLFRHHKWELPPIVNKLDIAITTIDQQHVDVNSGNQHGLDIVNDYITNTGQPQWASSADLAMLMDGIPNGSDPNVEINLYSAGYRTGAKGGTINGTTTRVRAVAYVASEPVRKIHGDPSSDHLFGPIIEFEAFTQAGDGTVDESATPCSGVLNGGDSGSGVYGDFSLAQDGTDIRLVGLAFAGNFTSGSFIRIDEIESLFGISRWDGTLSGGTAPTFSDGTVESIVVAGEQTAEFVDHTDGKRYYRVGTTTDAPTV